MILNSGTECSEAAAAQEIAKIPENAPANEQRSRADLEMPFTETWMRNSPSFSSHMLPSSAT